MSIFADDVIFSFQGSPDSNKPDLEKSYREEFAHPEESRIWLPEFEEFECSGDLGFIRSTWKLEVKTPDGKVEVKAEKPQHRYFAAVARWRMEDFSIS